jgi:glucose-1-phosphate thymidylyltransferase
MTRVDIYRDSDFVLEVNRLVLETIEPRVDGIVDSACEIIGRVVVEPGPQVSGSRIVGPVLWRR